MAAGQYAVPVFRGGFYEGYLQDKFGVAVRLRYIFVIAACAQLLGYVCVTAFSEVSAVMNHCFYRAVTCATENPLLISDSSFVYNGSHKDFYFVLRQTVKKMRYVP
jgi:hypothetical protein